MVRLLQQFLGQSKIIFTSIDYDQYIAEDHKESRPGKWWKIRLASLPQYLQALKSA